MIRSLIECTKVSDVTQKWAESRRDAVIGLTEVCQTQGIVNGVEKYVGEIVEALLDCLSEYTIDMRGDIGAWVREASMTGMFINVYIIIDLLLNVSIILIRDI